MTPSPLRIAVPATALLLALVGCGSSGTPASTPAGPIAAPSGSVGVISVTSTGKVGTSTWSAWPEALHDARHSGSSTTLGPQHGTVVWKRHLAATAVAAGPVLGADGTIYLVDPAGTLHALDPQDGHDTWTAQTGRPVGTDLSTSPLVLRDGSVVAGTKDGLGAWSAAGKKLWSVAVPGSSTSPVTLDSKRIYVGAMDGRVSGVDVAGAAKATLAWSTATGGGTSYGSVVTDGKGMVYTTTSHGLVAVQDQGSKARVAWTANPDDGVVEVSAGLSASGVVVLGTNGHHAWGYSSAGKQLWKADRELTYSSPSVTGDGLAYVAEANSRVHVFDTSTGKQVGRYPSAVGQAKGKTGVWTSVVVDNKHDVYFGTRAHYLVGARPDGTRLFTLDLGAGTASYPALTGNGQLVLGTDGGDVVMVK